MKPYYSDPSVTLFHGDCLDVLRTLPDASVEAAVTDPPYGLSEEPDMTEVMRHWLAGDDYTHRGAGFMGKSWDSFVPGPAIWRECFRVLKPGGHLLAFAGSRTQDLMGLSIRLAGFEMRDSIAWLYGTGFPKSMDVSKAVTAHETTGSSSRTANRRAMTGDESRSTSYGSGEQTSTTTATCAAPPRANLTENAATWQGWGTALKPAHEPIIVARKPLIGPGVNVLASVESSLKQQGVEEPIQWTSDLVSDVANNALLTSSSSTAQPPAAETSAANVGDLETPSAEKPTVQGFVTSTRLGGTPTEHTSAPTTDAKRPSCVTKSLSLTVQPATAVENGSASSLPLITSRAAATRIARQSGARSTTRSSDLASLAVTESFVGIATGLIGSRATVRIDRLSDGSFVWPEGLPRAVVGGPLTVAANVLAHGTGALNIDATRVAHGADVDTSRQQQQHADTAGMRGLGGSGFNADHTQPLYAAGGRWPANVVLDDHAAAVLDAQSGQQKDGVAVNRNKTTGKVVDTGTFGMPALAGDDVTYGGGGGASRFFAQFPAEPLDAFRYQAKAPTSERPRDGLSAHPTVKPLDLMRWLVRLVTPPGGTVLDPYAGSGTTAEACIVEGFRCVTIEREAAYLPLIVARLGKPIQVDLFGGAA